jgi:DNA-binding LytR/AlgR family response regulator
MKHQFLFFNSRDELLRIDISTIVFFEADGNYTQIVSANKLKDSVLMNLSQMVNVLDKQLGEDALQFMRIGKRFIININYIHQINILKQTLVLSDGVHFAFQISISKEALRKVKDLMLQIKI